MMVKRNPVTMLLGTILSTLLFMLEILHRRLHLPTCTAIFMPWVSVSVSLRMFACNVRKVSFLLDTVPMQKQPWRFRWGMPEPSAENQSSVHWGASLPCVERSPPLFHRLWLESCRGTRPNWLFTSNNWRWPK